MPDDVDGDLLARFVHGDRDAFERIFRQYERDVYRWILRIVREPSMAEDALVEAFWRAYRSRARTLRSIAHLRRLLRKELTRAGVHT
jgi:DNA-directed RNA polymerase specialized sigma24 family protein